MTDPATARAAALALNGAIADAVASLEEQTGIRLVRPGIMDATWPDLVQMEVQATAYGQAMRLIRQWIRPGETCRLGDRLKTIPADVAAEIERHLITAGLIPRPAAAQ